MYSIEAFFGLGEAERDEVPHNSSVGPLGVHEWRNDSANIRLVKAWNEEKVEETWAATSWAKKLARKKVRASLTDFQRFQLMVARKQKAALVKAQLEKM